VTILTVVIANFLHIPLYAGSSGKTCYLHTEAPSFIISQGIGYATSGFLWFSLVPPASNRTILWNKTRTLPPHSFPVHCTLHNVCSW